MLPHVSHSQLILFSILATYNWKPGLKTSRRPSPDIDFKLPTKVMAHKPSAVNDFHVAEVLGGEGSPWTRRPASLGPTGFVTRLQEREQISSFFSSLALREVRPAEY